MVPEELMATRFVFVGPPGCGKGTQASMLAHKYQLRHISSGDLLRDIAKSNTEKGEIIKNLIDQGKFVPDDVIIDIIVECILSNQGMRGFILDGFPRTLNQAEKLSERLSVSGIPIDAAVEFKVSEEILKNRIIGRLVHEPSGRVYHEVTNPPLKPMIDDVSGEPLTRRKDDTIEVLTKRLETYNTLTVPIVYYYKEKNLLKTIDASRSKTDVYNDICQLFSDEN